MHNVHNNIIIIHMYIVHMYKIDLEKSKFKQNDLLKNVNILNTYFGSYLLPPYSTPRSIYIMMNSLNILLLSRMYPRHRSNSLMYT